MADGEDKYGKINEYRLGQLYMFKNESMTMEKTGKYGRVRLEKG